MNEAGNIGALIGKDRYANKLVFEDHRFQAAIGPRVGNAAAAGSFVLVVHFLLFSVLVYLQAGLDHDSEHFFVGIEHAVEAVFDSAAQRHYL